MAIIRANSIIKTVIIAVLGVIILSLGILVYQSKLGDWTTLYITRNSIISGWSKINDINSIENINSEIREFVNNADEKHMIQMNNDMPNLGGQLLLRSGIQVIFVNSYSEYMEITIGLYQYRIYEGKNQGFRISKLLLAIQNAEEAMDIET